MNNFINFIKKIKDKKINVGIIGMGYVGLPLSILISKKLYKVYGFDEDKSKILKLERQKSYIKHISSSDILLFYTFVKNMCC